MFGLEILDVILGLAFVYLLLSLVATAVNEYIASILNKRGKVLVEGLNRLLADTGMADKFYEHPLITPYFKHKEKIERRMENIGKNKGHKAILRPFHRFFTWLSPSVREARYPSYLPARTFALALLEVSGYLADDQAVQGAAGGSGSATGGASPPPPPVTSPPPPPPPASSPPPPPGTEATTVPTGTVSGSAAGSPPQTPPSAGGPSTQFQRLIATLQRESPADVTEFANLNLATALAGSTLPADVKQRMLEWALGTKNRGQKLQNSVEVWFNDAMDRVSGSYKRHTQAVLFVIGLVVSFALNADTIEIWRRLSTDDKLREGLAEQAVDTWQQMAAAKVAAADTTSAAAGTTSPTTDTTQNTPATTPPTVGTSPAVVDTTQPVVDTTQPAVDTTKDAARRTILARGLDRGRTPDQEQAKALYDSTLAQLNQTQLSLGWPRGEAARLGLNRDLDFVTRGAFWSKLLGLLLTTFAVSLGAPFWFDALNKIINIRSAGRAPDERAKTPEAPGKRPAEQPTR